MSLRSKTKAQREAAQRERLTDLVRCMVDVACQGHVDDYDQLSAEMLAKLLPALRRRFPDLPEHCWGLWNLNEYETIEKSVGFLFENGAK